MKLLIGGVVALLCMQTINASDFETQCDRDLASYRSNVRNWFFKFEEEHDVAHDDLTTILNICTGLTDAIDGFLNAETPPTECEIATFFKKFYAARLEAVEATTHLRSYCDVLLDMADEYRCGRNDVCIRDFIGSSKCETDVNADKCDLADFFTGLASSGAQAKNYLDSLLQSCDKLGLLARNFDCTYKPSCGGDGGHDQSNPNTVTHFQAFIVDFDKEHDVAHNELIKVKNICDLLTVFIGLFENK